MSYGPGNYKFHWANEDEFLLTWVFKSLRRTEKEQTKVNWKGTEPFLCPTLGSQKLPLAALQSQ